MQASDWNDYQVFLAIARAGQIARAAVAIKLDPTTMGRRLRRLERRIGQTLFEKTRDGQILTEAGDILLESVERMENAALAIGEQSLKNQGLRGAVRISVSEGFGTWLVAPNVQKFLDAHPQLLLELVANSGFLSPSKREADIAVTLSRPKAGSVIASKLSDYALRPYASRDYLSRNGSPTRTSDLAIGHRLIGYIPDLIYAPELHYLDELHAGLAPTARSSSINAQHRLIASGAGIGVLPCFMGDADPSLVPVLPPVRIIRTLWLVTHTGTHTLARIRACKEWLIDLAQSNRSLLLPDPARSDSPLRF